MNDNLSDTDTNSQLKATSETDRSTPLVADLHLDKYSDPRVKITRKFVLAVIGVVLLGIGGSAL